MNSVKSFLSVFAGVLLLAFAPAHSSSDDCPNYPKADTSVDDLVNKALAIRVAEVEAVKLWGPVRPGQPVRCTDVNGDINYYMVPFRLDSAPFPSREEIFAQRNESKSQIRDLIESRPLQYDPSKAPDASASSSYPTENQIGLGTIPVIRPDSVTSHRVQRGEWEAEIRRRVVELAEDTKYGTIVVSARRSQYPVPAIFYFLPPFYITGCEAKGIAERALGTPDVSLDNILFLGPGDQYYRFAAGESYVLIHCKTLRVQDHPEDFLVQTQQRRRNAAKALPFEAKEQNRALIEESWSNLLGEIE